VVHDAACSSTGSQQQPHRLLHSQKAGTWGHS
jgi:hypothetical protein